MTPEDEFTELVRRALHKEAERHVPAGDGLIRIRHQVERRRRRRSWMRPMLAMAAASGVAAAAVAAPALLRQLGPDGPSTAPGAAGPVLDASSTLGTPSGTSGANSPVPPRPRSSTLTLPPDSGVVDMRTVWPYASRAEGYYSAGADVAAGKHPELTDAAQTAVAFVQRYVGPRVTLTAGTSAAKDRGVSVVVNRTLSNGTKHPVTQVYLVQVSTADKAPYVVARAERPALAQDKAELAVVPPADPVQPGENNITVSGTIRRPEGSTAPPVHVEVGDAAGSEVSFNRAVPEPSGTDPDSYVWTASVSLQPGDADRAVTLAAWTLDDDAGVLEFVATPVPLAGDTTAAPTASPPGATPTPTPTATPTG